MCIICIDFDRGTLTAKEARRALGEMTPKIDKAHLREVDAKIREAEAKAAKP
jgi:hypothetical protein